MNLPEGCHARVLARLEFSAFTSMTFPAYRQALIAGEPTEVVIAIGAFSNSQPAGLILARLGRANRPAKLLSLFCTPSLRRRGLGTGLLALLEDELRMRGVASVSCSWSRGAPCADQFERLLERRGWAAPQPRMLFCTADETMMKAPFFHAPVYDRIQRALDGAEVVPWSEITKAERESIVRRQKETPWIPHDLVPERHEEGYHPPTSAGLRIKGEVMGWALTHQMSPTVIRYTCSFVRRDYARRGGVIMLYRHAIWRQAELLPKGTYGIWTIPFDHPEMADFAQRRMGPYLRSLEQSRGSEKSLAG
jgi:GNAT superfamily N-acetyltransferase